LEDLLELPAVAGAPSVFAEVPSAIVDAPSAVSEAMPSALWMDMWSQSDSGSASFDADASKPVKLSADTPTVVGDVHQGGCNMTKTGRENGKTREFVKIP